MSKPKKKSNAGRKPSPPGTVLTARSVCWLRPAEKKELAEYAKRVNLCESEIHRRHLVRIGAVTARPSDSEWL